jgi:hypothetical protein
VNWLRRSIVFCIEKWRPRLGRAATWLSLGALAALAGCSGPRSPAAGGQPAASTAAASSTSTTAAAEPGGRGGELPGTPTPLVLEPPKPVRNGLELRLQAAYRLVAANPGKVYLSEVPDVLLAIPVLEVELHIDGRVKHIHVLRKPGQAHDTVQLAIDAVHRAAPFGDVSRMPKPWKFSETFLFNDERQFKPRTLDQ